MPFPTKVQPVGHPEQEFREPLKPPVLKSRLKRLFDLPFNGVLKTSSTEKTVEFEPSTVCLDKMVQNFLEENACEKSAAAQRCGRNRCNCFNGNSYDSSDDEFDFCFTHSISNGNSSFGDPNETLKSLIPCATTMERNLLADTSKLVEKNKTCRRKEDLRKMVTDGLLVLGFQASICKSKWEKSSSIPAGEHEYIDVIMEGERVLIDIDFRSEFEIARSTGSYKAILQSLPVIFVGKTDRLQQIIAIVSEAARQSLKKKGMHVAPWRKAEYIKAKWLSPFVRAGPMVRPNEPVAVLEDDGEAGVGVVAVTTGEWVLIFGEKTPAKEEPKSSLLPAARIIDGEKDGSAPAVVRWQPPPVVVRSKSGERGNRVVVTGLAALLTEKP